MALTFDYCIGRPSVTRLLKVTAANRSEVYSFIRTYDSAATDDGTTIRWSGPFQQFSVAVGQSIQYDMDGSVYGPLTTADVARYQTCTPSALYAELSLVPQLVFADAVDVPAVSLGQQQNMALTWKTAAATPPKLVIPVPQGTATVVGSANFMPITSTFSVAGCSIAVKAVLAITAGSFKVGAMGVV